MNENARSESAASQSGNVDWVAEVDNLIDDLRGPLGDSLPFDPTPHGLYTAADLYEGIEAGFAECRDQRVYARARKSGGPEIGPVEGLAHRLHDHGITVALDAFRADRSLVGVMGGHALVRGSAGYAQAVELGRTLATNAHCVTTGGGPGAMEAANFGALTSRMEWGDVEALIDELAEVPTFHHDADGFIGSALSVLERIVDPEPNLSVPTWFYGHEPSNPFATSIAKYFSNSEREDGLLAIAKSGIVFVRGGPGTLQEVFQDAAQNAYRTFGPPAPMLFLDPPHDPTWWVDSGVLSAVDRAFLLDDGSRRPGWDLISHPSSLEEVIPLLAR